MMTVLVVALIVVLVNTLVLAYAVIHDRRYRIDTKRIGGTIAANLLKVYEGEVQVLSESGVKQAARERYLELCGAFGLPETAVDTVIDETWRLVYVAQGEPKEAGIYD